MQRFVRAITVTLAAFCVTSTAAAEQRFIEGVFTATESGAPIELIAYAEPQRVGMLKMGHGFLEDAPILPRTYRFLVNVPGFAPIAVLAVNKDVFTQDLDRLNSLVIPHTTTMLNVSTAEIGVPRLEKWEEVLKLRKSLKATPDKPLVFFVVLTNGVVRRFYPFFLDQ